jgi:4-hydroxy-tetrahydrodipicolinate synthase
MSGPNLAWGRLVTAMVTPFATDGSLDEAAVRPLVEHLIATGTTGLVVCGTTGESPTLSDTEKLRMFALALEASAGRVPVIASTGTYDTAHSIRLSKQAEALGVHGLLLITPYYNRPSQEGLYRHFRAIAESVDVPIMLYNVPPRTGVNIEARTVLRLFADVPNIVAVKEAAGSLTQVSEIVAGAPEGRLVYSGEDALVLPILAVGGYGVVSVTSHLVGRQMGAMMDAYLAGDVAEAARLHLALLPIVRACFQPTTPSPAPLKAALAALGFAGMAVRPPLVEADPMEAEVVRSALRQVGLLRLQ